MEFVATAVNDSKSAKSAVRYLIKNIYKIIFALIAVNTLKGASVVEKYLIKDICKKEFAAIVLIKSNITIVLVVVAKWFILTVKNILKK